MRIVLLSDRIPPELLGGAEKVIWSLAVALTHAGHDVHIIAGTVQAERAEQRDGVHVHYLHTQTSPVLSGWVSMLNLPIVRRVRQLLIELRPDVVNAHNIHNELSFACLLVAQWLHIATVFTAHDFMTFTYGKFTYGVDPNANSALVPSTQRLPLLYNLRMMHRRFNPFRTMFIRYVLGRTQARISVSDAQRQVLETNLKLPFETIYNGVDPDLYERTPAVLALHDQLRARWNVGDRPVIMFSGRFGREKGSAHVLKAMQEIVKVIPDALLIILTAAKREQLVGNAQDELRDLWERHIIIGGWLSGDELIAAYQVADVVVIPSIYVDPLPMVNFDAMASGVPVIGTCFGGTPEAVKDGEAGLIVNPFNTTQFAEAIIRLLRDPALRERMGAAGKRRITEHFNLETQAQHMLHLYQRAISSRAK